MFGSRGGGGRGEVADAAAGAAHHCDAGVVAAEQEEIVPFGPNY